MEQLYKLKEELKPYFSKELQNVELSFDTWNQLFSVNQNALEPVKKPLEFQVHATGRKNGNTSYISDWSCREGACFYFTLEVKNMEENQYMAVKKDPAFFKELLYAIEEKAKALIEHKNITE